MKLQCVVGAEEVVAIARRTDVKMTFRAHHTLFVNSTTPSAVKFVQIIRGLDKIGSRGETINT